MLTNSNISLADIAKGSSCRIAAVELEGLMRRRIMDLGLVPGTSVQCVRTSPSGDPIAFYVRGSMIALRKGDAHLIKVYP